MTKSLCALARRPDLDRAAFHDYYERHHAPLGVRHFPFTRYVRNHLIDAADVGFDTITEFWADDIEAAASLMDGPIGGIMREDESRFMDRTRIAPAGADETILSGGPLADPDGVRTAILARYAPGAAEHDVSGWARALADRHAGVAMDRLHPWGQAPFPADAVIWLAGPDCPDLPPTWDATVVRARRLETPADLLRVSLAGA